LLKDFSQINGQYEKFKELVDQNTLKKFIYILCLEGKYFDAAVFLQYVKQLDYDLVYKILKRYTESDTVCTDKFKYIWKMVYFEYLSNYYYKIRHQQALNQIKMLIKRTSNHQFFKKNPLRYHFKILNFFKLLDYS
ncbi:MAG: hypothetical protein MJ252_09600, partial [archaeon]|nr:hypothetical protein [archaeon]